MMTDKNLNRVFNINSLNEERCLSLPHQIFINKKFEFILTIGGDLADNKTEYNKLMSALNEIGETNLFILENVIIDKNKTPFFCKIPVHNSFDIFQKVGENFDEHFGWSLGNFFVYGEKNTWGIYMCELPTINIIGCDKKYTDTFRNVYRINGTGYYELKEFIAKELKSSKLIKAFEENYKL